MTTYAGNDGVIRNGATAIAEVEGFDVKHEVDTVDDTAQGDSWDTHLTGRQRWSGNLSGHYFPGDTGGQATVVPGASLSLELYPIGTASGRRKLSGTATITSVDIRSQKGGEPVDFSAAFTGNGALTTETII